MLEKIFIILWCGMEKHSIHETIKQLKLLKFFFFLHLVSECISTLGTANIHSVWSRAAIPATISVGRWSLVVGVERESARRIMSTRQNGFAGLLQEGEFVVSKSIWKSSIFIKSFNQQQNQFEIHSPTLKSSAISWLRSRWSALWRLCVAIIQRRFILSPNLDVK